MCALDESLVSLTINAMLHVLSESEKTGRVLMSFRMKLQSQFDGSVSLNK